MKAKSRYYWIIRVLLLGIPFIILSACAMPFQKGPAFDDVNLSAFPIDRAELLALSYRSFKVEGPVNTVAISLIAAQNVLLRDPDNELAIYYAARSARWLIEFGGEEIDRGKLSGQGHEWALKLLKKDPGRGEYYFLAGAHLGFIIQESISPSLIRLRKVHGYFNEAVKIDPNFEDGGPLRALGTLLIQSPPWPTGVGDIDEGIENLEKAARMFPAYPANHLYLAYGYMEDKRWEDALKSLQITLDLTKDRSWGVPGRHWRNFANVAMRKVKKILGEEKED